MLNTIESAADNYSLQRREPSRWTTLWRAISFDSRCLLTSQVFIWFAGFPVVGITCTSLGIGWLSNWILGVLFAFSLVLDLFLTFRKSVHMPLVSGLEAVSGVAVFLLPFFLLAGFAAKVFPTLEVLANGIFLLGIWGGWIFGWLIIHNFVWSSLQNLVKNEHSYKCTRWLVLGNVCSFAAIGGYFGGDPMWIPVIALYGIFLAAILLRIPSSRHHSLLFEPILACFWIAVAPLVVLAMTSFYDQQISLVQFLIVPAICHIVFTVIVPNTSELHTASNSMFQDTQIWKKLGIALYACAFLNIVSLWVWGMSIAVGLASVLAVFGCLPILLATFQQLLRSNSPVRQFLREIFLRFFDLYLTKIKSFQFEFFPKSIAN